MSGALWIKITTAIWDDEKIKIIRHMEQGDTLLVIWFQLITQAGKCNAGGRLQLSEYIPLDADMLATLFDRPQAVVERALATFQKFQMIDFDDDCPVLPNWGKYQSEGGLAKINEQNRRRQQEWRERQKQTKQGRNVTVTQRVTENVTHKDIDLELEKDLEKDIKPLDGKPPAPPVDAIPYGEIIVYLNAACGTNFKATSEETKRLIRARWANGFREDDFKRVIDTKAAQWNKEPTRFEPKDMRQYLRPKTLFGTGFESYLNEKPPRGGGPTGGGNSGGKPGDKRGADYSAFIDE